MRKHIIVVGGAAVVLLSFIFIGYKVWGVRTQLLEWRPDLASILVLLIGVFLYASSNLCLSNSWHRLLVLFGSESATSKQLRNIYAGSQIAKYLPGNVMHIAGRHILSRELGIRHSIIALSSIYEMLGLCTSAVALTCLGFFLFDAPQVFPFSDSVALLMFISGAAAYFFGLQFFGKVFKKNRFSNIKITTQQFQQLVVIFLLYLIFFTMAGGVLLMVVFSVGQIIQMEIVGSVLFCFSIAWFVGFVTPGAPSGVGIREAIIVTVLEGAVGSVNSILIALLFRLVTISGDVLFFLAAGRR